MLTQLQKRHLKALAHSRKPVVIIGGNGLTPAVLAEIDTALAHHELIKIRVNAADREQRERWIAELCAALASEQVQRVGHVATLFRRNPEARRVELP
jgi:RNA-binding protein